MDLCVVCNTCAPHSRIGWTCRAHSTQVKTLCTICKAYTPCRKAGRAEESAPARCRILLVLCAKPTPLVAGLQGLRSALAGVDLLSLCTLPALHIAAPADLALAGPCHHTALCVVAAATANALTVLLTVTPAACCARGKAASQAEAGRVVQVYKLWCSGQWVTASRSRGPAPRWGDGTRLASGFIGSAAHL